MQIYLNYTWVIFKNGIIIFIERGGFIEKISILLSFLAIAGLFVFSVDKKLKSRNKSDEL